MTNSDRRGPGNAPSVSPLRASVLLPALTLLGYVVFLLGGYGSGLGKWQPVPIFAWTMVLVLTLTAVLAQTRSVGRLLYVSCAQLLAVVLSAALILTNSFVLTPTAIVSVNILLTTLVVGIAAFQYVQARRGRAPSAPDAPQQGLASAVVASGCLGLAVVCFVEFAFLAYLAAGQGVRVDIPLPAPVDHLEAFDLVTGVGATVIGWLFLLGIGDVLLVAVPVSAVALLSANDIFGIIKFLGLTSAVTQSPYAYLGLNLLLVILAITANARSRRHVIVKIGPWKLAFRRRNPIARTRMASLAVGFATLAILFYVAWALMQVLSSINYVHVDLNQLFGLTLPPPLNHLETVDLGIALGATLVSLTSTALDALRRMDALLQRVRLAANHVPVPLRMVLTPLVWFVPATCAAVGARQIVDYFDRQARLSAAHGAPNIAALFNPFSSLNDSGILVGFGLLIVAVVSSAFALAVVEFDERLFVSATRLLFLAGRLLALTFVFFTMSLTCVNALIIFLGVDDRQPFRLGGVELAGLLVSSGFVVFSMIARRAK